MLTFYKILASIILSFLLFEPSNAQKGGMAFHYLTANDGLSQNRVTCIIRDSREYMWFGTYDGLNRYDGSQVTIYRNKVNDTKSISCDHITDICEDQEKNIWIATEDGLNLYVPADDSFISYRNNPSDTSSISSNYINCVYCDKQHRLWIGTENGKEGLNKWDPNTKTFVRYEITRSEHRVMANAITGIVQDQNGNIWVVGRDNGLFRFDPEKSTFVCYRDASFDNTLGMVKSLFVDDENTIWISTYGAGLFAFDPSDNKFTQYNTLKNGKGTSGKLIYNIIQEDSGHLLIAVDQGGIDRFNQRTKSFEYINYEPNHPDGLNNNGIWCLYKDREGILWVGTSGGGVNISNPKSEKFKLLKNIPGNQNSLSYNVVGSIFEDSKGLLWIATDGGGVSVYNPQTGNFKNYKNDPKDPSSIPCNVIRHVVEDKNNDYWMGTWGGGLIKLDHKTGKFTQYLPESREPFRIPGRNVWNSIVDHNGIIWLSMTEFGVDLLDPDKGFIKRFRPNPAVKGTISHRYVNFFYEDRHLNMWLCTNDGLDLFDSLTNSFKVYREFPSNDIRSFIEDQEGYYWVGTINKGIIRFKKDGDILKIYNTSNGLPSNLIDGILEDDKNNLWISTGDGISRINYKTGEIRNYTLSDGLQGKQFFIHSCLKTRSGEMYFGGFNGLNYFNPDSLKDNHYIPPVYINEFLIFNKPVSVGSPKSPLKNTIEQTREIVLNWEQSVFSFGFVALNYTHPESNLYAYKMEGFDKAWNYTDASRRLATYTNLNPGTYIFRVKASNNDGVWNEQGTAIKIIIRPPWWRTWWFKIGAFVAIIMLTYTVYRWRVRNIHKRSKELEHLVTDRTAQLIEANKELEAFAYSVSHDLRAPLRHVDGYVELLDKRTRTILDEQSRHYMDAISKSAKYMGTLIDDLLSFSRMGRQGMSSMQVDLGQLVRDIISEFDPDITGKNIQWKIAALPVVPGDLAMLRIVLVNLISNALKFTRTRQRPKIEIGCSKEKEDEVVIYIRDNGVGFDPNFSDKLFGVFQRLHRSDEFEGTGIGLANVKRIINRHGGKVWAEGVQEQGATFYFSLPLH